MATAANAEKAAGMRAYMKSAMPYYGINLPELRAITRKVFSELPIDSCSVWGSTILSLWRKARHREERYAALSLLSLKKHRECITPDALPMLEEMVTSGAWWDLVDELSHVIGDLLHKYPKEIRPVMRAWSTDSNLWKRRVSIICQLSFKRDT